MPPANKSWNTSRDNVLTDDTKISEVLTNLLIRVFRVVLLKLRRNVRNTA